jgi:hypothetical protein
MNLFSNVAIRRLSFVNLLALLCLVSPRVVHAEHFGFQEDFIYIPHMAGEAQVAGADTARYPIDWRALEPSQNVYDQNFLGALDNAVNTLYGHGQKTILMLLAAPAWAGGSASSIQPPSAAHVISYENTLKMLLDRYPGKIRAVEIWNEPNLVDYGNLTIQKMDALCQAGRQAIDRSGQTTVKLIAGGLSPVSGWQTYLQQLRDVTGPDCDLAFHPYDMNSNKNTAIANAKSKFDQAKSIAGGRDLWITEYGFGSTQFSGGETAQEDAVGQVYTHMKDNGARTIIYYRLIYSTFGGGIWPGFGALREDNSRKPVFYKLRTKRQNPPPFSFDSSLQNWVPGNAMSGLAWTDCCGWPGVLYGDQLGTDSYIFSAATNLEGLSDTSINVSVFPQNGNTASHNMQFYWKTAAENFWDANKSSPAVTYTKQNGWIALNLSVNNTRWTGDAVNQLRLDFDNANSQTRWLVNHVLPQWSPKWQFGSSGEGWRIGSGLSAMVWWTDATWPGVIYADQTSVDAFIYSPGFEYFGGANDVLKVRVYPQGGTTANHEMKVYWTTKSDGSWTESKSSATVAFTAQNVWTEITLKVGANASWYSDYVKQLRIDLDGNSVNSGARWIIDHVTILPQSAQQ